MTARLHRSDGFSITGNPLILLRATTLVTTTCTTVNVFVPLDIGTMIQLTGETADQVVRSPDWGATDIAGADHKIEPVWPVGIYKLPVFVHLYSAQLGTSHSAAENFTIALYDVQTYSTPALGAELLFAQDLDACPVTEADDTLELAFVCNVKYNADLRFFVKNRSSSGKNFGLDPLQISFQCLA
jgi:hypothetical protein